MVTADRGPAMNGGPTYKPYGRTKTMEPVSRMVIRETREVRRRGEGGRVETHVTHFFKNNGFILTPVSTPVRVHLSHITTNQR